jgi:Rieske Fe-S protein
MAEREGRAANPGQKLLIPAERLCARITRREWIGTASSLLTASCTKSERWDTKSVDDVDGVVELEVKDYPELATPGGMIAVRSGRVGKPVLVMRIEHDQFRVLSLRCPHLGCTVRWDNDVQLLVCPCHGSKFADDGAVLEGPAQQPLTTLRSALTGTWLRYKVEES